MVASLSGESCSLEETDAECLAAIKEALNPGKQCDGVVIIIDELGKALDYQPQVVAICISFNRLQMRFSNSNVVVIGLLHQSFAAYAKAFIDQNEWEKSRGNF